MVRLVKDLLAQSARETFVGRTAELEALSALLRNGPRVIFLHGIAGVGKSALLTVFAERARAQGATVIGLDCRAIEPSERGFLQELSSAIGGPTSGVDQAALSLQSLGRRFCFPSITTKSFDSWIPGCGRFSFLNCRRTCVS